MSRPLLACFLACLPLAAEPRGEVLPVLRCPEVAQPPRIDGLLDEPCWAQAVVSAPFVTPAGASATYVTTARLAHDAANLYLAVECADPDPGSLVAAHTQRDSDVYLDDCVEVFLDGDLDFRTYHHFLVNAGNVQRDEAGDLDGNPQYDVDWNLTWPSATRRTDKGWTVELALPLAPLGIALAPEPVIGLNLCRSSSTGGLSCLSATHGGFHDPHRHAMVVLGRGAAPQAVEPGGLEPLLDGSPGRHAATLAAPAGLQAEWRTYTVRGLRTSAFVTTAGSALSWELSGAGSRNLCLILRDAAGQVVAVHNVVVRVPLVYNVALGHRLPAPSWLSLWWAESLHKILPDKAAPPDRDEAAELSCAGNEVEACQVVLRAQGGASVTVEPPLFRGPRASLPADRVRLYRVSYVKVDEPSDAYGGTGRYPDPLLPVSGPVPVSEGENTVLWVQVSVPKGQPKGRYTGDLVLRAEGKEAVRVPLRLRVYGFDLTDETHTATAYGLGPDWEYLHITDRAQQEEVFVKYLQAFREHRLSPYEPFGFHPMRYELHGPRWTLDTGGWKLTLDQFGNQYFVFEADGKKLGTLTNTVTQFEREGVGWQGSGVGWPGVERLKEIRTIEHSAARWVFEVTGERRSSGPANRAYEITFRFTIPAGRRQLIAQMVRLKNTDTVRYQVQGYFYILNPEGEATQAAGGPLPNNSWVLPGGARLGAVAVGGRATMGLAPIYCQQSDWLEPGQSVDGYGPAMVFFSEPAGSEPGDRLCRALAQDGLKAVDQADGAAIGADVQDDVKVTFDFTDFDQAAAKYLDEWKLNGFNFPAMPGSIAGHERFTPEYERLHKLIYGPMTEHLREKGWLSKAYSYWYDEPEPSAYPYVLQGMDLLGRNCPGLTRLLTEQIEPALEGHIDLWCPVLSNYQPKLAPERQERGELVWWYVCTGPRSPYPNNFIDHPGLHHRIRFWMMEKYGVTGSLYWATTYWRGQDSRLRNPWESGMSVSPDGGYWGNGDGLLLYPACGASAETPCLDGPVITQRIEILRDGLEDREYNWTLRQLVARALRMGGRATQPGRSTRVSRALDAAYAALGAPDRLAESLTQFDHDPAHLLAERAAMAEALEALTPALR